MWLSRDAVEVDGGWRNKEEIEDCVADFGWYLLKGTSCSGGSGCAAVVALDAWILTEHVGSHNGAAWLS